MHTKKHVALLLLINFLGLISYVQVFDVDPVCRILYELFSGIHLKKSKGKEEDWFSDYTQMFHWISALSDLFAYPRAHKGGENYICFCCILYF